MTKWCAPSAARVRQACLTEAGRAASKGAHDGDLVAEPAVGPGAFSPMGGLHSSVRDIALWLRGFATTTADQTSPHPLRASSRREMQEGRSHAYTTLVAAIDSEPAKTQTGLYGFGLACDVDSRLGRFVHHSGGYPGFGSHMRWHPASGFGIVALANRTYAPMRTLAAAILHDVVSELAAPLDPAAALWPPTRSAMDVVERLVARWDDALADASFAVNVDLDIPRAARRAAFARAGAALGTFERGEGGWICKSPAHVRWRVTGEHLSATFEVLLTPERPPRIQMLAPSRTRPRPAGLEDGPALRCGLSVRSSTARALGLLPACCDLLARRDGRGAQLRGRQSDERPRPLRVFAARLDSHRRHRPRAARRRALLCRDRARVHAGLRADAGYAGLVQHNPFAPAYETFCGRDEPYSLRALAAFVELPRLASRRTAQIRTDGRNVETFDRLRYWAYAAIAEYRCGPRETWEDIVVDRALAIAEEVRAAHPQATHAYSDAEALDTAKSVARWVWSRYDGGSLTRVRADAAVRRENDRRRDLAARRERGCVPRDVYLAEVQRRRVEASRLRGLGVAIEEIARRLGAGVRSVHRWIAEIAVFQVPPAHQTLRLSQRL